MLNQARNSPGLMPELQSYLQDPTKPVYGSCAGMILMASEDGVGGGKKPQKGLGALQGMNVWRNAYGGEPTVYSNCLCFWLNHHYYYFSFFSSISTLTAQNESFEANIPFQGLLNPDIPFPAIFIRAPAIHSLVPSTPTLSSNPSTSSKQPAREDLCVLPPSLVPHIPEIADSPLGPADTEAMRIVAMKQGKKLVTSFHPELSGDLRVHEFFLRECCGMEADV
jgi:5'-phosphate synthase pdxT subunit